MSVGLISLCSFFSGVGSCAAFQAALKTGNTLITSCWVYANNHSDTQLAYSSRIGYCLPIGCFRIERLLLHSHRRHSIPR